jgi:hypothetical protein
MPRQIRYRLPLNLVLHPPLTPTSACDRLPAPLAPMMPTVCKYGTSTLISRATTTEPKLFSRPRMLRIALMIASYNRAHPWMLVGASAVDNSIPARGDRLAVSARAAPTDIQGITWCRSGRMAVPRRSACNSTCARFARGHIHLRQGASWLDEFVTELVGFPSAPFNDQVDALSQYLDYVGQNPPLTIPASAGVSAISTRWGTFADFKGAPDMQAPGIALRMGSRRNVWT